MLRDTSRLLGARHVELDGRQEPALRSGSVVAGVGVFAATVFPTALLFLDVLRRRNFDFFQTIQKLAVHFKPRDVQILGAGTITPSLSDAKIPNTHWQH